MIRPDSEPELEQVVWAGVNYCWLPWLAFAFQEQIEQDLWLFRFDYGKPIISKPRSFLYQCFQAFYAHNSLSELSPDWEPFYTKAFQTIPDLLSILNPKEPDLLNYCGRSLGLYSGLSGWLSPLSTRAMSFFFAQKKADLRRLQNLYTFNYVTTTNPPLL